MLAIMLFLPWLIILFDYRKAKRTRSRTASCTCNTSTSACYRAMKKLYDFFTAPVVKFCYHSVTTGTFRYSAAVIRGYMEQLLGDRAVASFNPLTANPVMALHFVIML